MQNIIECKCYIYLISPKRLFYAELLFLLAKHLFMEIKGHWMIESKIGFFLAGKLVPNLEFISTDNNFTFRKPDSGAQME